MADAVQPQAEADPQPAALPTIYEAKRVPGPSGAVECGAALTLQEAVKRRMAGSDVVVVGGADKTANRRLAQQIEATVGSYMLHPPQAGPESLPHYQQRTPPPEGHAFYEVDNRKARRKQ
jgi:hypothetical protein